MPRRQTTICLFAFLSLTAGVPNPSNNAKSAKCPIVLPQDKPFASRTGRTLIQKSLSSIESLRLSQPRIVNGDLISENLSPYLVAITDEARNLKCTGTLLSPSWVVTAAYCSISFQDQIVVGVKNLGDATASAVRKVIRVETHPSVATAEGAFNDIVLFEISPPASEGKFMKVNMDPSAPKMQSFVRVLGYGDISSNNSSSHGQARQVDLPVTTPQYCSEAYGTNYNASVHFCAGYEQGGCDSCAGDGGGPVIQYSKDNEPILLGIVSFGESCAKEGYPGVNLRTSRFQSFFDSVGLDYKKSEKADPGKERLKQEVVIYIIVGSVVVGGIILLVVIIFIYRKVFWPRRKEETVVDTVVSQE